ncbi:unnamed protein product [Arctia plantaginis]|uniref:RING-type domain-containing protein n=1 Tax=Arctia plantaginis TaxID=874455 RepID=A0A8S1BFX1_ARCPL|nr:unnamed protein product [Arctia plantaginis]
MRDSSIDFSHSRASNPASTNNYLDSKTSLSSKVSSIISSCRICLSSIFDAATLTCGHKYCERCLDQYWRVKEMPDCIVCPLCRTCAFNVDFSKTEGNPSTEDFRSLFTQDLVNEAVRIRAILWSVKVTAVMPAVYYLLKWLKPYLIQLFTCVHLKLANKLEI